MAKDDQDPLDKPKLFSPEQTQKAGEALNAINTPSTAQPSEAAGTVPMAGSAPQNEKTAKTPEAPSTNWSGKFIQIKAGVSQEPSPQHPAETSRNALRSAILKVSLSAEPALSHDQLVGILKAGIEKTADTQGFKEAEQKMRAAFEETRPDLVSAVNSILRNSKGHKRSGDRA